jgi:acylphosphatase
MIRLTAYISGRVQRVGYRAKVVSLAKEMGLAGIVQNRPDGRVLVIAEGEKKEDLEKFAAAIQIENAFIHVDDLSAEYTQGTGQYSSFRKVTGPDEVGERLDDGIEILKEMVVSLKNLTTITKDGFENLTTITEDGFENLGGKMDQTLDKQDETIEEVRGLRVDLKSYMDRRFKRIEADLAELKEMKAALKEKGLI